MAYPITGSILNSNIHTGLSTQISILVNNQPVGAVQTLTIQHSRSLYRVPEIGTDGILEITPQKATEFQATVKRIVFDKLRLPEAFSRGFLSLKSQLLPFDILILDRNAGGPDETGVVKTQLVNCWFSQYSTSYQANDFIVSEDATIFFEDIINTLGNTNQPAAQGGARGLEWQSHERERQTDAGAGGVGGAGYRGTMDFSNLINAAFDK
jgi:hypothetical protein